ncbi:hypothetical protein K488DRAFT_89937 [Vararia minispora EC-137]|uniref:Uncharacterized protein n=1 Tax=Vararia minispora EC-137 TaxID=1314806 RepID=A0ACB8Q9D7_9AGAM|nr:hypothetical protein K488DRAFT_89937 [Vararia minispora EC-137]
MVLSVHFDEDPVSDVVEYETSSSASDLPHISTPPTSATRAHVPTPKAVNLFINPSLEGTGLREAVQGSTPDETLAALSEVSATEPPIGTLKITANGFPLPIVIEARTQSGVLSALDVVVQLREYLQESVTSREYDDVPDRWAVDSAFFRRTENDAAEYNKGIRRIDLLLGRAIVGIQILSDAGNAKLLLQ